MPAFQRLAAAQPSRCVAASPAQQLTSLLLLNLLPLIPPAGFPLLQGNLVVDILTDGPDPAVSVTNVVADLYA